MYLLLVARLCELYPSEDIFDALELPVGDESWLASTKPLPNHRYRRGPVYHRRRVKFFIEEIRSGRSIEPIEIANEILEGVLMPIVLDGHHRLLAHVITNSLIVPAIYKGDATLLRYLKGTSDRLK